MVWHCCQQTCAALDVPFYFERMHLAQSSSIEAQARKLRYAALGRMCMAHQVQVLLTAHHQDDQAETVLLQLLRGTGLAGGMEQLKLAPDLLGTDQVCLARPVLALARAELCDWLAAHSIGFVDDDSNFDPRYTRSALRELIVPHLAREFPGFQQRLARNALHAQSAQRLLQQLAGQDWQRYRARAGTGVQHDALQMQALHELNPDRVQNLLRYWLTQRGARMPPTAWLTQLITQLQAARDDAQVCIDYADAQFHRHRGHIYLASKWQAAPESIKFQWHGETEIYFASFSGRLQFCAAEAGEAGVDADWLRQQTLQLAYRKGGERFKLASNRPNRSLKQHFQSEDVPGWLRSRLPLLYLVNDCNSVEDLIFVAGLGVSGHYSGQGARRICLRWHADGA
jgi:tRNA(Ile)-lysidine synthase